MKNFILGVKYACLRFDLGWKGDIFVMKPTSLVSNL